MVVIDCNGSQPVSAFWRAALGREIAAFLLAHVRLARVPFVPEIELYQADDVLRLWSELNDGRTLPFWAAVWAGGQALARFVLDHPEIVAGTSVADIGSGSGLVAIAASKAGAAGVTAFDIDPRACATVALNAQANFVDIQVCRQDVFAMKAMNADIVLAGDVFYERVMSTRMLALLKRCRASGSRVLVGDPGRPNMPVDCFVPQATYNVCVSRTLEDADVKRVTIWEMA
jgi:predicted nicotinamide N-methyase